MARRLYRAGDCVEYGKSTLSDFPRITLRLSNMRFEEYPSPLLLAVDTGFEGSILVTEDVYRFFEIGELPRKYWRTYRSLVGSVTMRVAKAIAFVNPNIRVETYVETPVFGVGKMLAGRELLNNLTLVLDGVRRQTCLASLESADPRQ